MHSIYHKHPAGEGRRGDFTLELVDLHAFSFLPPFSLTEEYFFPYF